MARFSCLIGVGLAPRGRLVGQAGLRRLTSSLIVTDDVSDALELRFPHVPLANGQYSGQTGEARPPQPPPPKATGRMTEGAVRPATDRPRARPKPRRRPPASRGSRSHASRWPARLP